MSDPPIFVGTSGPGERAYYQLVVATDGHGDTQSVLAAMMANAPGMVIRELSLRAYATTGGVISDGETCSFSEIVGEGAVVDQTLRCMRITYRRERPIADPQRALGVVVDDPFTTAEDGDPAMVWEADEILVRDDSTGPRGAFEARLRVAPPSGETP